MRLVIQRAAQASVSVDGRLVSEIGKGLFILVGVEVGDGFGCEVGNLCLKFRQ